MLPRLEFLSSVHIDQCSTCSIKENECNQNNRCFPLLTPYTSEKCRQEMQRQIRLSLKRFYHDLSTFSLFFPFRPCSTLSFLVFLLDLAFAFSRYKQEKCLSSHHNLMLIHTPFCLCRARFALLSLRNVTKGASGSSFGPSASCLSSNSSALGNFCRNIEHRSINTRES